VSSGGTDATPLQPVARGSGAQLAPAGDANWPRIKSQLAGIP
jgi:hypothetical protein